jgi:glucose-6-phosphate 1-dehydrogenase
VPPLKPPDPQAIVIFGASGDLTRRKLLPAFYHLFQERLLPEGWAIVGYSRTPWKNADFRDHARQAIGEFSKCSTDGADWDEFAQRLYYVSGDINDEGAMDHLHRHLHEIDQKYRTEGRTFFYAATPPVAYPRIVDRIAEEGMAENARVVLEKPFGHDLVSAAELNRKIHEVFTEDQVFRIDHYLGKETVQNILAFRFANGMFEPIWNRRYVDHVQITVAEDIGIEGRGSFYEGVGALRDMIQAHLFQVMTFLAMEPPVSFEPDRLRDEKTKLLRAVKLCDPARVVRGQYAGYRGQPDVAPDSDVETFVAVQVEIDNWRWAGVPFFLRTGKKLRSKVSEITMAFKEIPFNVFEPAWEGPFQRNHLAFRIQPNEGITLSFNAKTPGPGLDLERVNMDFDYDSFGSELLEAYEILLLEAMEGDHTLFLREDTVERAWEVLQPVLDDPPQLVEYEPGTWGPQEADHLVSPRRWHVWAEESHRPRQRPSPPRQA